LFAKILPQIFNKNRSFVIDTLSSIFIKEGKNFITNGPTVIKSNIAIAEIVLSNR